ncbi:MAG: diguanylate cyclase [Ruminococcus sp.]|nr:diguanylate cyclase [Ruminococcus sp.]
MAQKKSEKSISLRSFIIVLAIFLAAHIVMSVMLITIYNKSLLEQVNGRMLDVANTAAHLINGDELEKLSAEDKGSESYKKIYDTLRSFQDSMQLDYIYAIEKTDDGAFVITIDPDQEDPSEWGEEIETTDALKKAAKGTADVDNVATSDEWGRFYSAYSPIFNSQGKVVGMVGVDFNADWYESMLDNHKLIITITSMIALTAAMALGLILHTFNIERYRKKQTLEFEETIQEQKQELGSAIQLAYTDPLTGVKNKHAYLEAIERINKGISDSTIKEFGVIVFDLNGLKVINDTLGHEEGDKYIRQGCSLICSRFCHSPVFRIGGDEFTVILEGSDYNERESLLAAFDELIELNQKTDAVVVSTGMDIYNKQTDGEFSDVFERADKKMYDRKVYLKSNGR